MKILLSKYKILLSILIIPYILIIFVCTYKTKYSITTTGDITDISSFISVDGDSGSSGSFNSIFVYSTDESTLFQKWICELNSTATVETESENYLNLPSTERNLMGSIQKTQSLEASTILAYNMAKLKDSTISLNYSFSGYIINYRLVKASDLKIGDIITKIDGVDTIDKSSFYNSYINMHVGSELEINRSGVIIKVTLDENNAPYYIDDTKYGVISVYEKYNINLLESTPRMSIGTINTLGPSAGLLQTLSIYDKLIDEDLTKGKIICGTGTISVNGNVGEIGGIKQKVLTAYKNNCTLFICPKANEAEGLEQYNKLKDKSKMKFVVVSTFMEAIECL